MNEDIKKIINHAIWAPSGDNCQPWRFKISDNKIYLINVPEKDTSLYNFRQIASYFSHGCLIENIKISSSHYGYSTNIELFPNVNDENLVAIINLKKEIQNEDPLFLFIEKRVTNRKPYKNLKISNEQKRALLDSSKFLESVELKIIEDKKNIKIISKAASVNEKLVLENRNLHNFLFNHITWTKLEDEKKRGFFVDTLELNKMQKMFFKLSSNWRVLKFLNRLNLSGLVSKSNADLYSTSSAVGIICSKNNSKVDFLNSGRVMQRIWLEASRQKISIQPITGTVLLFQRICAKEASGLSPEHSSLVIKHYDIIRNQFGINKETISFMFRMGFSDSPTSRSFRLEPIIDSLIKK